MALKPGQKVFLKPMCMECSAAWDALMKRAKVINAPGSALEFNTVYTISGNRDRVPSDVGSCRVVFLEEKPLPIHSSGVQIGYLECAFAPISETYLENFNKLITPTPETEDIDG
jgi:hypothetical protein